MMRLRTFTAVAALALIAVSTSAANAQFRPGSTPDGGRIRAICNDERFTGPEREDCVKMMRDAKTDKARAEAKAIIQDKLKERQKLYDEAIRNNGDAIRNSAKAPQ
jgi:hypothetical protein